MCFRLGIFSRLLLQGRISYCHEESLSKLFLFMGHEQWLVHVQAVLRCSYISVVTYLSFDLEIIARTFNL